jgi:hypothetical protein
MHRAQRLHGGRVRGTPGPRRTARGALERPQLVDPDRSGPSLGAGGATRRRVVRGNEGNLRGDRPGDDSEESCFSANDCTAVGRGVAAPPTTLIRTVAQRREGTKWVVEGTPDPGQQQQPDTTVNALNGVFCCAGSTCVAVGFDSRHDGSVAPLAEVSHASTWTIQPTTDPAGARDSELAGVSCPSPNACVAVGSSDGQALIERYRDRAWFVQPAPDAAGS